MARTLCNQQQPVSSQHPPPPSEISLSWVMSPPS
jgi:hypothetical protein